LAKNVLNIISTKKVALIIFMVLFSISFGFYSLKSP